jgi:prepilin-type N-terminal cleavage/methylation domain-containing protein/prepilin-type processing-associated H-X9-DG protein
LTSAGSVRLDEGHPAFTLIELLVVIAVISILAALLLPVLASAKIKTQRLACVNNIRQLAIASLEYEDDMDIWVGPTTNNPNFSEGDWMGAMVKYYGNSAGVLLCPSTRDKGNPHNLINPGGNSDSAWHWTLSDPVYVGSYGYNKWLAPNPGAMNNAVAHPDWLYRTESSVMVPTFTPMFADSAWINFDPMETDLPARNLYDPVGPAYPFYEGMQRVCMDRHGGQAAAAAPRNVSPGTALSGGIDISFVDGHVELVRLQNLWDCSWHLGWVTPAVRPQ